jgi:hypothetical protein
MALDLELRYATLADTVDHVCTGNSAYRREALHAVGLLNEDLGYGYDNDLSYRLSAAGYRLVFRRAAASRHHWREGLSGYLTQQFGFGYGRLDVVAAHPMRVTGDAVSPASMMAQPVVTALALACLIGAVGAPRTGILGMPLAALGAACAGTVAIERAVAGVKAWRRFGDPAALAFPVVHTLRNLAWVAAMVVWCARRVLNRARGPGASMKPRPVAE